MKGEKEMIIKIALGDVYSKQEVEDMLNTLLTGMNYAETAKREGNSFYIEDYFSNERHDQDALDKLRVFIAGKAFFSHLEHAIKEIKGDTC